MEEILGLLLLIAFLLIIASLPFNVVMLLWLRRDHPDVFTALGQPHTFGLGRHHHGNADYARFLFLRRHRQLGDARISRMADIQLGLLGIGAGAMLLMLLLILMWRP